MKLTKYKATAVYVPGKNLATADALIIPQPSHHTNPLCLDNFHIELLKTFPHTQAPMD